MKILLASLLVLSTFGASAQERPDQTNIEKAPAVARFDPLREIEKRAYIAQAVADKLLENGSYDEYRKASDEAIQLRRMLRAQQFSLADAQYALFGDASVYAKLIYPMFNDGFTFVDARQIAGPGGKPMLSVTRKNNQTGEPYMQTVPVENVLSSAKELRKQANLRE